MRDAGLVDVRTLTAVMGLRFFGVNAAQAYNVAGSFCRFLYDTRGADKLERIYRAAGGRRQLARHLRRAAGSARRRMAAA